MKNWTNLHLEPKDYRIYNVNIHLYNQYGISVSESQRFFLTKCPKWQLEILAKAMPHVNNFLAYMSLCQQTFPEPNLLLKINSV